MEQEKSTNYSVTPSKNGSYVNQNVRKSPLVGPLPPLYFDSDLIQILESSTCLGLFLDNKLYWSNHIFHVKKIFMCKVGALKRMNYLSVKTLAEIYFKTIIPSVTYGNLAWGNISTTLFSHLGTTLICPYLIINAS